MYKKLQEFNLSPKTILDIGANVGEFANASRVLWPDAKVTMVEANKNCEEPIKAFLNEYYIEVLGSEEGKDVDFFMTSENPTGTGNSIYKEVSTHYADDKLIIDKRKMKTLANLFGDRTFDLIKMDTQGSELDIICGGEELVKRAKWVIIEVSMAQYNEGAPLYEAVMNKMLELDFPGTLLLEKHIYPRNDHPYLKQGQVIQQDIIFFR